MNVHKVISLTPPLEPDSLYYVADGDDTQSYITDNAGAAKNVTNDQAAEIVASQAHIATVAGNPHGVTKSEVGLGQADNTSDANKPVSILQAAADSLRVLISSIVDNLTSNDTDKPLSANQGLVLKGLVDGKQPTIDQDLDTAASPSFAGGTINGDLTVTGYLNLDAVVAKAKNGGGQSQTIPNATWTVITVINSKIEFDPFNMWTGDRFQPYIAGYYSVDGMWIGDGLAGGTYLTALYKNGTRNSLLGRGQAVAGAISGFGGGDTVYLNGVTDYVQLRAYQATGAPVETLGTEGYTRFSITKIGD